MSNFYRKPISIVFNNWILSLVVSIVILLPEKSYSQKEGYIGIFGKSVGLDFNYSPVKPFLLPNDKFDSEESCATISDKDGHLLFYTDGGIVYNRQYEVMPNGYDIGGKDYWNTTTQTVIVPKPYSSFLYYIFSAGYQGRDLKYSLIDMSMNDGLGDVVFKDSLIYKYTSERLHVVKASSGDWLWVITHEYASNVFRTFRVTENGLDTASIRSAVGEIQKRTRIGASAAGNLKASPAGNLLAAASDKDEDSHICLLELFDFDKATGRVSNARKLFTGTNEGSYGVEFSPDGTKLYHSRIFAQELYQYDLMAGSTQNIINSATKVGSVWGGLQLAPDGKIYAVSDFYTPYLDVINNPNEKGISCNYQKNAVYLLGKTVLLGLPVFSYDIISPQIIADRFCEDQHVTFSLLHAPDVSSVTWNFGDPTSVDNSSDLINPSHVFFNAGSFAVTASIIFKNNFRQEYHSEIVIHEKPPITLGQDIELCVGVPFQAQVSPVSSAFQYQWQDGSKAASYLVKSAGSYWAKVSNKYCSSIDTLNVFKKDRPFFDLPDTSKCKNKDLSISISIPDASFKWQDSFVGGDRSLKETGTYSVTATNECGFYTDKFSVSESPDITLDLGKDLVLCEQTPVTLNVMMTSASYRWNDGNVTPERTVDKSGAYWVEVFNQCVSLRDTINILYLERKEGIIFPNVITANGDNINDQLILDSSLNNPPVDIFNRWGNLVYSSQRYMNNWQGDNLSAGFYYYSVHDACSKDRIRGWLHLIK